MAYSVLTHEAIIDTCWQDSIQPILRERFPSATQAEVTKARAYVYGGAIIQDMGYYPFSSHFFSDLTHYVRAGDFILALLAEAKDVNELAFALGALAHYAADQNGHSVGTNRVVPLLYPKLRGKFGEVVTYHDNPAAHLKTEFAFDVTQVARGRYAPDAYHDFIGFEVAQALLERAFAQVYGFKLDELFFSLDLALGTYRFSVSNVLPKMTRSHGRPITQNW
jgi:hypothetical protein